MTSKRRPDYDIELTLASNFRSIIGFDFRVTVTFGKEGRAVPGALTVLDVDDADIAAAWLWVEDSSDAPEGTAVRITLGKPEDDPNTTPRKLAEAGLWEGYVIDRVVTTNSKTQRL